MTVEELFNAFRLEIHDVAVPQLWSDPEVFGYMDDAQKMFCRLAGGLADATSSLTRIKAVEGEPFAKYDPRILALRYLQRTSDGAEVTILNIEDIQNRRSGLGSRDYGFDRSVLLDEIAGSVRFVVTGMDANKLRLVHVPEEDDVLQATVYRLPLESISSKQDRLEIDEQHHRGLLHWMKHLAYNKHDAETYDRTKSETFKARFQEYCEQSKQERERREHKPRLIQYVGGY